MKVVPGRKLHLKFDRYLVNHKIIRDRDYSMVHDRVEKELCTHGHWDKRYESYYTDIDSLILWITKWSLNEGQSDFFKVVLGHLVLDEKWTKRWYGNDYDLMKSAFRSFVHRGFSMAFSNKGRVKTPQK